MDYFCGPRGTLAVGAGERSHDWRIHSYPAGYRNRCSVASGNFRTKTCVNDLRVLICIDSI